jgi:hypothetical protein
MCLGTHTRHQNDWQVLYDCLAMTIALSAVDSYASSRHRALNPLAEMGDSLHSDKMIGIQAISSQNLESMMKAAPPG